MLEAAIKTPIAILVMMAIVTWGWLLYDQQDGSGRCQAWRTLGRSRSSAPPVMHVRRILLLGSRHFENTS